MPRLDGVVYKAFGNYVVFRGFAPIGEIAKISKKPKSYQRDADEQHKIDIVNYLNETTAYFPEITLACRAQDYEGLIASVGNDQDISSEDGQFVKGLKVLGTYLPQNRHRARLAYLDLNKPLDGEKLVRVDGNHRLEPFSSNIKWWYKFVNVPEDVENEPDEEKKEGWIKHQAETFKKDIESRIVPYTILISDAKDADNFEAKIFHDINFKQLPLREESSLRIISELQAFSDIEKLGAEYPITMELIKIAQTNIFEKIHWLKYHEDLKLDFFRTSCLRIVQLLRSRKTTIQEEIIDIKDQIQVLTDLEKDIRDKIKETDKLIINKGVEIEKIEVDNLHFQGMSLYKRLLRENNELKDDLKTEEFDLINIIHSVNNLKHKQKLYNQYINSCESKERIIEAIHSIESIYEQFTTKEYGNIALLCTMVYYSMLDKNKLYAFVDWAQKNGINKIISPDDILKEAASNLITMFEEIFKAKKNEIFISMQFGDSQSELIFEKIVRTIERFNEKHKTLFLNAKPIRIDRTIKGSTFSIQDTILQAIKSCSLIIADLSSTNINVYHEIGYAMGVAQSNNIQEPNLILLYKEDTEYNSNKVDVDRFIGFNLRNLSQLRFKDYKQLTEGLLERLEKHYGVI